MIDTYALVFWAIIWGCVGISVGFILAAIMCAASKADEFMTYDEGFKAGYDQCELDNDFKREIEAVATANLRLLR